MALSLTRSIGRAARAQAERLLMGAPPEFFLVAACCRWPADAARAAAVRAAAAGSVDWPRFQRIVARHRVWGLARDGLARAGVSPPPEIARALDASVSHMARRNLALAAETVRLQRLFETAGIGAVFVKGATLAALAYGDFALKHGLDIDILVAASQFALARAALEQAGYAATPAFPDLSQKRRDLLLGAMKEWQFVHQTSGVLVDLHWRLTTNGRLMNGTDAVFPTMAVAIGAGTAHTLRREELFGYLCAHGAHHSWSRLKWLADVSALLAAGDADVESLHLAAKARGAGRCAGQALSLRERLLGAALPAKMTEDLRGGAAAALLELAALDALLGAGAEIDPYDRRLGWMRAMLTKFLLGEGWRYAAHEGARYLVSPVDVLAIALPERLTWLYYVLRAPLWALRRVKAMLNR